MHGATIEIKNKDCDISCLTSREKFMGKWSAENAIWG